MVEVLANIAKRHRSRQNGELSDTLYYELMAHYFVRIQEAQKDGYPIIAHGGMIAPEIFYAMGIVPMQMESVSNGTVATLKNHDEVLALSSGVGQWMDTCTGRRIEAAMLSQGWIPRPKAIVWGHNSCDPNSKAGYLIKNIYGVSGFFLDRPYGTSERDRRYYAQELGDMVNFIESLTNRKVDWNRFRQVLVNAREMTLLHKEICELQGAVPCPMSNRKGSQVVGIGSLYSGTVEGVNYFQIVRDELRSNLEKGIGSTYQEKYRLIGLFHAPIYVLKILDWMEREHGAVIVSEPFSSHWGDWEVDEADLLGSLAARCFATPNSRQLHGPAHDVAIPDMLEDALKYKVNGAIYWANVTCPQCLSMIRLLTDILHEKVGIPSLVLYSDTMDPSSVSHEDLKTKIEDFLDNISKEKNR